MSPASKIGHPSLRVVILEDNSTILRADEGQAVDGNEFILTAYYSNHDKEKRS